MEYNTERSELLLKEYGRSVQEMIAYICTLEDKQQRTAYAYLLVNLMKQLNPAVRDSMDTPQRVWDHLHYMSGFKLDIDGPYPAPEPEKLFAKPTPMAYPKEGGVRFKNYGSNIERMVQKAMTLEDIEDRHSALVQIGRLMKSFYYAWYKEVLEDEIIMDHIRIMSGNKADLKELWEQEGGGLFESRSVPNKERHHQILMKANAHSNGNSTNANDRPRSERQQNDRQQHTPNRNRPIRSNDSRSNDSRSNDSRSNNDSNRRNPRRG